VFLHPADSLPDRSFFRFIVFQWKPKPSHRQICIQGRIQKNFNGL
jgi:hypothetical protein